MSRDAGSALIEAVFLAEVEQADPTGIGAAFRRAQELAAEAELAHAAKVRRWEQDAPKREAAQLAYERAWRRRDGQPQRLEVAAAMDWTRPARLVVG